MVEKNDYFVGNTPMLPKKIEMGNTFKTIKFDHNFFLIIFFSHF
jgi:hypothetical protein